MSDALAQVEKRLLANSGSKCGAQWLCPDEIGSGFTFLEDRAAGREKLIRMVNQQVIYFQFLMNNLPIDTKTPPILTEPAPGTKLSPELFGCQDADDNKNLSYLKKRRSGKVLLSWCSIHGASTICRC